MAKTATTKKTTRSRAIVKPNSHKVTVSNNKSLEETVKTLSARLDETDKKLSQFIREVHSEMKQEMLQGPKGLARRIAKSGLLD